MNYPSKKYWIKNITAVFFIMVLAWFTVSLPFVYQAQQQTSAQSTLPDENSQESDDCDPFSNATEEKASSGTSIASEEYLHHNDELFHNAELFLSHNRHHAVSEYVSFHGEMLCPPPNFTIL